MNNNKDSNMTKEYIDRFERMHRPGGLIEELTSDEVEEDYHQMVELQHQMMEYAFRHEDYRKFMDLCYTYLCNWYWAERAEMVEVDIEIYRTTSNQKRGIYCDIERHVMTCIIDKLQPSEKRIEQIARSAYRKTKRPF
tara:strand:+ start:458 stop:871 length:414 start_codon:yes stop_codon:yes gene_type:complete